MNCQPLKAQGTESSNCTAQERLPKASGEDVHVEKKKYSQMMAFTKLSNQVYGEDDFDKDSWSLVRQSYQGPDRHLLVTKSDAPAMPAAICAFFGLDYIA